MRSRDRRGRSATGLRRAGLAGVRTTWRTLDDGEFFCSGCGGDRSYRLRFGRRRLVVLGVPLVPRGDVPPVVECAACRRHYDTGALDHPTTNRLAAMLRDAVYCIALAVLAAEGAGSRVTRDAAVESVRAAGYPECTEDRLLERLAALRADPLYEPVADDARYLDDPGADDHPMAAHIELCEALEPLTVHLAPAGREALLLQGAAVALADGPYEPAERDMLESVGCALALRPEDTERLLAAARTPS
ncbi:hypothetical protein N566_16860 [Streptomycetaceae bacterium MP113-05]|nr:hypothetical protein N566_16860 [Streptomycetaceae bacterium MP113-05]